MDSKKSKSVLWILMKREAPQGGPSRKHLQVTGSSGKTRSGQAATSVTAGGTSVEGRDKPMARHLPEVKTKIPLMGVSFTDTPLQGARTSSKPVVEEQGV
jgi:hypothetical protein